MRCLMTNDVKLEIGDELLLASIPLALVERGGAPYGRGAKANPEQGAP